jgi:hypothetical protein
MSSQIVHQKTKREAMKQDFWTRALRAIEMNAASFSLLFHERDYINHDRFAANVLVSIDFAVLIGYCFGRQSTNDWRANSWTSAFTHTLQYFDIVSQITNHLSYEGYLAFLGFCFGTFIVVLLLMIYTSRTHEGSGIITPIVRTFIRLFTPILFIYFHSPSLRVFFSIVS